MSEPQKTSNPSQNQVQAASTNTPTQHDDPKIKRIVGKYLIEVERSKCISVANCVAIAPDVFALDEEQIAVLIDPNPDTKLYTSDEETILMSARSCPTQAIIVRDAATGEQLFP